MKLKYIMSIILLIFAVGFVFSLQITKTNTNNTLASTDNFVTDLQDESLNLSQDESLNLSQNETTDGLANPAAVYCKELGYNYKIITEKDSSQFGVCIFPDKSECDEWTFYSGECGVEYNYCTAKGYDTLVKRDGKDGFYPVYTVCTFKGRELGSVNTLMNLSDTLASNCDTETIIEPITNKTITNEKVKPFSTEVLR